MHIKPAHTPVPMIDAYATRSWQATQQPRLLASPRSPPPPSRASNGEAVAQFGVCPIHKQHPNPFPPSGRLLASACDADASPSLPPLLAHAGARSALQRRTTSATCNKTLAPARGRQKPLRYQHPRHKGNEISGEPRTRAARSGACMVAVYVDDHAR